MTVIVGVCRKYLINKHLVFRTDLYFPVGIKKIPVLILMKPAEPLFPVASVNYGIGISKILIVVIFRINAAILILIPIYVMAQIKVLVLCRLQDGKTDIRTGNFQPCIGFCIYRLKRLNIRRAVFLKDSAADGSVCSSACTSDCVSPCSSPLLPQPVRRMASISKI